MTLQFYTRETNSNAKGLSFNEEFYSPFSGTMESIAYAEMFLKENGKFWHERNQKLVLFYEEQAIATVEVDKLVKREL